MRETVDIVFNMLRELLMRVKQPRPKEQKNRVVYELPCASCNHVYIGKVDRVLVERIKETDML